MPDEARLELREYASLVDLELFRMDALMRLEAIPLADRRAQVREWVDSLLVEMDELKQNTLGPLEGDIGALAERVRQIDAGLVGREM